MIDTRKVQLMTRIANYEKSEGICDLKINRYGKKAYIALRCLEAFILINIFFVLLGCLFAAYLFLTVANSASNFNWMRPVIGLVLIYAVILVFGIILEGFLSKKRYEKMCINIQAYEEDLRKLQECYSEAASEEILPEIDLFDSVSDNLNHEDVSDESPKNSFEQEE